MTSTGPLIIGLTGGIGSGKSAVTNRFAALGASIVDTDEIAHSLTIPGGLAIERIRDTFGDDVITPDGALDRHAMRERVFKDPDVRRRLEAILHPMIRQVSDARCLAAPGPYVVLAVPLLVESASYHERVDRVCVVDCPVELQVERVRLRSGLDESQIRAIIATQASRDARRAIADDVIDNAGSLEALHAQVDHLHAQYLEHARSETAVRTNMPDIAR